MVKDISTLPRIVIPEVNSPSKFIQLMVKGNHYFRSGNSKKYFHPDILKKTLNEFEIPFKVERKWGSMTPLVKGKDYELKGAGRVIRRQEGLIVVRGFSTLYNLGIHEEDLNKVAKYLKEGERFEIQEDILCLKNQLC